MMSWWRLSGANPADQAAAAAAPAEATTTTTSAPPSASTAATVPVAATVMAATPTEAAPLTASEAASAPPPASASTAAGGDSVNDSSDVGVVGDVGSGGGVGGGGGDHPVLDVKLPHATAVHFDRFLSSTDDLQAFAKTCNLVDMKNGPWDTAPTSAAPYTRRRDLHFTAPLHTFIGTFTTQVARVQELTPSPSQDVGAEAAATLRYRETDDNTGVTGVRKLTCTADWSVTDLAEGGCQVHVTAVVDVDVTAPSFVKKSIASKIVASVVAGYKENASRLAQHVDDEAAPSPTSRLL